jgi:phage terminase large subunit GpA-like protein
MLAEEGFGGHAKWIAEDPDAEVRSYRANSFYSSLGWLSWLALCKEYAEAKLAQERGDDTPMIAFFNTRLAQTFAEKTDKIESDDLRDRAEDFALGIVPAQVSALTVGVDVQDNRFEVSVYGWGPREESWTVAHEELMVDPARDDAWRKLSDYLATRFPSADGRSLPIAATAIDTGGHFTHQVYAFCRARKRTFAVKGADRPGLPVKGKSSTVDVNYRGKIIPNGVRLWFVGTDSAKDLLHNRMRMKRESAGYIHFSDELPDTFFDGMTSEERTRIKTARGMRSTWVKKQAGARNEPLDCAVYALFAAHVIDLPRYTEQMWQRLRARQEKARDATAEQAAAERDGLPPAPEASAPTPKKTAPASGFPRRGGGFVTRWRDR